MNSVTDIFAAFGGPASLARVLGVRPSTASEMKRRGSIPSEYWRELIVAAKRLRIDGIDADMLATVHARESSGRSDERRDRSSTGANDAGERAPTDRASQRSGHFSRFYDVRRSHFATAEEIRDHIAALREEWDRR
jgi:hypothetical protein